MKTLVYKILVLSFLANLTGCVTATFQSNVQKDVKPEFRRILVMSRLPTVQQTYLPTFQTAFPAGYQVCTVSNSPISFDSPEESIEKQRQACQSEVLLTIDFNRNYTSGYGRYISSNNELFMEMTNLTTGKPFWRAIITTVGSNEVPPRQIVNQLIKDGIIEGTLPLEKSYQSTY